VVQLLDERGVGVAAGLAAADAIEAALVAALVVRGTPGRRLRTPGDLLRGLLVPAALGCAAGAVLAAAVLHVGADADLLDAVRDRWGADVVGIVAICPIALVTPWRPTTLRDLHVLALPVVAVSATAVSFAQATANPTALTLARLSAAGLLVVAARVPLRVTAVSASAIAALALWMTAHGSGPFVGDAVVQADVDAAQTVIAVLVLGALALGTSVERARDGDARLRALVDNLPHGAMVLERPPRGEDHPGAVLRPTYANPAMLRLFAAPDLDALGGAIHGAITTSARTLGEETASSVAEGHADQADGDMHVVVDGVERDVEWTLVPIAADDGRRRVLAQAVDVTAARAAERELRASEERFRLLAEHAPVGILLTDATGAATSVNAEWRRLSGASADEDDLGRLWVQRIHPDDRDRLAEGWERALTTGTTYEADYRLVAADGSERWVAGMAVPLLDGAGRLKGMVGTALDVSERKRHEAELARRALHDGLTGLPNREHFEDRVRAALAELDGRRSLAVLFVDLDGFKVVNDTHGHDAGDMVLCEVATRLADVVREPDVVARLGGDEFAVLCVGDLDLPAGHALADRLRARVSEHLVVGGVDVSVGVSIGVATTRDPRAEVVDLLRAADQSMYGTKRAAGTPATVGR
jgi:diguanylate cyclase (GGDEF)-like protein/PAS domain S-box-containing protein